MKIITANNIIVQKGVALDPYFSNADAKAKKEKDGFFSKGKRDERKAERKVDKTKRVEKRETRRAERKAKYGARPLKQAVGVFKDALPGVFKKSDGSGYQKPDGTDVPKENIAALPGGVMVDKTDAAGRNVVVEGGKPVVNYKPNEVVQAEGADGTIGFYKATDTTTDSSEAKKPISTTQWLLIGGSVLVVATIVIIAIRKSSGK